MVPRRLYFVATLGRGLMEDLVAACETQLRSAKTGLSRPLRVAEPCVGMGGFREMMRKQFGIPGPRNRMLRKIPGASLLPLAQLPSADELFRYADTNEQGFITFDEFVGIMFDPDRLATETKIMYFKSAFTRIADGEEHITTDALAAYFGGAVDVSEIFEEMLFARRKNGACSPGDVSVTYILRVLLGYRNPFRISWQS